MKGFFGFLLITSISGVEFKQFPAQTNQSNPLNFTVSPLLTHDVKSDARSRLVFGGSIDETQEVRLCQCSEVNSCQMLSKAEVNYCVNKCRPHLNYFNKNHTEIAGCFKETLQELEIWNNCLRMSVPNFCNKKTESESSTSAQPFEYEVESTYSAFLRSARGSGVKRARRAYVQMRTYQHCFNACAKKAESQCLLSNGCRAFYPSVDELHRSMNECEGLFPKALHSSFNTCECLVQERGCLKFLEVCPMIGNRFLMTVL